jgi:hypothetical protein
MTQKMTNNQIDFKRLKHAERQSGKAVFCFGKLSLNYYFVSHFVVAGCDRAGQILHYKHLKMALSVLLRDRILAAPPHETNTAAPLDQTSIIFSHRDAVPTKLGSSI